MAAASTYVSVLSIAGSDSGAGAGIQADLKTFSALGCYGTTAITAVTCQNTLGVTDIYPIPANIVYKQIRAVLEDIKPSVVKIGMIPYADVALAIVSALKAYPSLKIIVDPVMISSSGRALMEENTVQVLIESLFPIATLVTPNLAEAGFLTKKTIANLAEMQEAARNMLKFKSEAVLVKGGHLSGSELFDVMVDQSGKEEIFTTTHIESNNTHGTGCTLSSAIAAYLALGYELIPAIKKAKLFVHKAIQEGADVKTGAGTGPLNHFFAPERLVQINLKQH
jgi:hydroxymethylpyrimidine/phosphomethylpyrimidine kinase